MARDIQQRTFKFAVRVVRLCHFLESTGGVGRSIGWQLIRSGPSVGANVEEAQASRSRADFIATCAIALREARETHYWLRLTIACELVPFGRVSGLLTESGEIVAILTAIVNNARHGKKEVGP